MDLMGIIHLSLDGILPSLAETVRYFLLKDSVRLALCQTLTTTCRADIVASDQIQAFQNGCPKLTERALKVWNAYPK